MQQLLSILPKDLYTEPIIDYEPSILFQTIRDEFLEISYSPEAKIFYIFSCHSSVYRLSFILRNPIPLQLQMEDKMVAIIILRTRESHQH